MKAKNIKPRTAKTKNDPIVEMPGAAEITKKVRTAKIAIPKFTKTPSKLGINEIVSATVGLKEDEAKQLLNMAACLDTLKKGSRPKVMTALRKLFG